MEFFESLLKQELIKLNKEFFEKLRFHPFIKQKQIGLC